MFGYHWAALQCFETKYSTLRLTPDSTQHRGLSEQTKFWRCISVYIGNIG